MGDVSRGCAGERESDVLSALMCGRCTHWRVDADRDGVESSCPRIDHKHIRFAEPYFKSYDCGRYNRCVCREFAPNKNLYPRFAEEFVSYDDCFPNGQEGMLWLVVDGNTDVLYTVRRDDFANGTYLKDDGSLKWVEKFYYKRCAVSERNPLGRRLIRERSEGDDVL